MKKIIVRADDLGYSRGINYGIADSVQNGIIRSVGVMVNMPDTEHGLALLKGVPVCYGLHTNICVGKPLTDPEKIPSLVDDQGNFKSSKVYRSAKEDFVVLEEVMLEIEAQLDRFIELMGEHPHYFEGHAVMSTNFYRGLATVAAKRDCDYLGPDFAGGFKFRNTNVVPVLESMKTDYDPLGTLMACAVKDYPGNTVPMMVCHPGYLDAYIMKTSSMLNPRVLEVEMACAQNTKEWLIENKIELITYDDLT